MEILPDGSYVIGGEIAIEGEGTSTFVFGSGWLLEILRIDRGYYHFFAEGEEVRPNGPRFGIFYPPFTIVRPLVREMKGSLNGIGSVKTFSRLPKNPFIFETDFDSPFSSIDEAFAVLESCFNRQSIEPNSKPSILSVKAKKLIDENYLVYPSIARIADRLGVSHEHLSRQFKRDFQMSPGSYLHQLRVAEATHRLSIGEEIIDVSQDVGYNDLSRFYKQFRKTTRTSPALCRQILQSRRP